MIERILSIDNTYIIVLCGLLIVLIIISMILKAIKVIIMLVIVGILGTFAMGNVVNLKEQYGITLNGNEVTYSLDGETQKLDISNIENIGIKEETESGLIATITSNENTFDVEIPKVLYKIISIGK